MGLDSLRATPNTDLDYDLHQYTKGKIGWGFGTSPRHRSLFLLIREKEELSESYF